jgi:hypothetical protein
LAVILYAGAAISREIKCGAFEGVLRAGERLAAGACIDRHAIQQTVANIDQVAGCLFTGTLAVLFMYVLLVYGQETEMNFVPRRKRL